MKIDASTLSGLDKDALVALLTTLLTDEVAHDEPAVARTDTVKIEKDEVLACASTRTLSGNPCGTMTKGGRDCGKHEQDDAELARKREAQKSFLAKRREYAAKAKSKDSKPNVDNKALAQELRAVGVTPNGEAWGIAKGHVVEDGMTLAEAAARVAPDYA